MNTDKLCAEAIAKEYAPQKASRIMALKKLDRQARLPAEIFAYSWGSISTLILGTGMSLCLGAIGPGTAGTMVTGIIAGLIGIAGAGVCFPLYRRLLAVRKEKYAFEIMELAKEITEE